MPEPMGRKISAGTPWLMPSRHGSGCLPSHTLNSVDIVNITDSVFIYLQQHGQDPGGLLSQGSFSAGLWSRAA